jgi:hypothetical protein
MARGIAILAALVRASSSLIASRNNRLLSRLSSSFASCISPDVGHARVVRE